jgi:hypothetical protein
LLGDFKANAKGRALDVVDCVRFWQAERKPMELGFRRWSQSGEGSRKYR